MNHTNTTISEDQFIRELFMDHPDMSVGAAQLQLEAKGLVIKRQDLIKIRQQVHDIINKQLLEPAAYKAPMVRRNGAMYKSTPYPQKPVPVQSMSIPEASKLTNLEAAIVKAATPAVTQKPMQERPKRNKDRTESKKRWLDTWLLEHIESASVPKARAAILAEFQETLNSNYISQRIKEVHAQRQQGQRQGLITKEPVDIKSLTSPAAHPDPLLVEADENKYVFDHSTLEQIIKLSNKIGLRRLIWAEDGNYTVEIAGWIG